MKIENFIKDKSTRDFQKWVKQEYVNLAKKNPIKYLCKSESDFFIIKENGNMAIVGVDEFIGNETFKSEVKDAIDFRIEQYYEDRFNKKSK